MFAIRRLEELARKKQIPLCVCFIDLSKAYDSVDQTLLWTVLARFRVPQNIISFIREFRDGMRAWVRLDDRVCSGRFAMEQGLRQGRVLAPLLFNIFYAVVVHVTSTRFKADTGIGRFGAFEEEKGSRRGVGGGGPVQRLGGGGGGVTILSLFWEGTAQK